VNGSTSRMKYKYIVAYQIAGLIHAPDSGDVEIYADESGFLANAIPMEGVDKYCYEVDRAQSLGHLVLRSAFGRRESDDLRIEMEAEVGRIRERRNKELGNSEILVFTAEGMVEPDFSRPHRETDDFVLGFEVINKDDIAAAYDSQINAVLAALCLSTEHEIIQVKRIQRGVYLVNEFGKPVYSLHLSASVNAFVSRRIAEETIGDARIRAVALMGGESLASVNRLLVQAICSENDRLRRFIFAWSALEILVNKVFPEYENRLFTSVQRDKELASPMERYFRRIRGVMKDKYSIADKFSLIAAWLGDDACETDMDVFISVKKKRDVLFHGEALDEDSLPIPETIGLLKKYLRLHTSLKRA